MENFQEKIIELEMEIYKLKKKISKLEKENKELKDKQKNKHNERGAGRNPKFTDAQVETIKTYRIQGIKMQAIADMFNCSIGLIHKILKESGLNSKED